MAAPSSSIVGVAVVASSLNADAYVAWTNLDRAARGRALDVATLTSLSVDARGLSPTRGSSRTRHLQATLQRAYCPDRSSVDWRAFRVSDAAESEPPRLAGARSVVVARGLPEPEAPPERARGLARHLDRLAAVRPRDEAARRTRLEARHMVEVQERAAMDALERAPLEPGLEALQRVVGEEHAPAGVERDELSVEDRVADLARVEETIPASLAPRAAARGVRQVPLELTPQRAALACLAGSVDGLAGARAGQGFSAHRPRTASAGSRRRRRRTRAPRALRGPCRR